MPWRAIWKAAPTRATLTRAIGGCAEKSIVSPIACKSSRKKQPASAWPPGATWTPYMLLILARKRKELNNEQEDPNWNIGRTGVRCFSDRSASGRKAHVRHRQRRREIVAARHV